VNDFWFATTHIGLKKSETNQTIEMVEILKQYPRFIVVGDFNQIPLNGMFLFVH
jgi:endonuclease/exonuclease/phosphatase family metal-dependent hydrolase